MKASNEKQLKAKIEALIATLGKVSEVSEKSLYATDWGAHTQEDRQFAVAIGCAIALHHIEAMKESATKVRNIIRAVCWDHSNLGDFRNALSVFDPLEDALHAKIESFGLSEDKKQQLRDVASANEKLSTAHDLISEAHPTLAENEMRENPLMRSKIDFLSKMQIKLKRLETSRAVNNAKLEKRNEVRKMARNWRNAKALEVAEIQPPALSENVLTHAVDFCLNSDDPRCAEILLETLKSEIEKGLGDAEDVKNAIVELTLFLRKNNEKSAKLTHENRFLRNVDEFMNSLKHGPDSMIFLPNKEEEISLEDGLKKLMSFCLNRKCAESAKYLLRELRWFVKNEGKLRLCLILPEIKRAINELEDFLKQGSA